MTIARLMPKHMEPIEVVRARNIHNSAPLVRAKKRRPAASYRAATRPERLARKLAERAAHRASA